MIYDVISYNGEEDTLEIRLNILNDVVDKFIIVEATETFSRQPKELTFIQSTKFAEFMDKIVYYVIDDFNHKDILDMAYASDNTGNKETHWIYEFYQKELIKDALIGLNDNDIVFISDCDEIWNPEIAKYPFKDNEVYKPLQNLTYIYYLNQRTDENWTYFTGTIVTKYKNIKDKCLNHLRTHSKNTYGFIENGGWHFNALGGAKKKINSFMHPVYTDSYMKTREKGIRLDEKGLPEYVLNNKEKYKHLWK